ncbi:hypothetical protein SRABI70_04439 [Pseudomonas sp. Bi70]|uniref:DUF1090 domain-containing protein n=1 Tax=Pseudomonas sp. Bi70 TaxID=2821127 RepID=UPI001DA3CF7B|nr:MULTISPECIES: DUF1090 domain-containing protein [unclassified Pseudomonas]CAH0303185.1 hypothetical protein SRABI70_04439 [Pseudomonas sp. Bi70]
MKALIACLLFVVASPVLADPSANPLCETKAEKIEKQLQAAWAEGLADKAKGLSAALDGVRENCSDKELMRELQARIDKARDEIREREADLRDAELSGDPGKIVKRQAKLDEAMQELKAAEAEFPR